jgi:hypothetical protein
MKITGIALIPVILFFIPPELIMSQHSVCLIKNITGHECYGCGMTRAIFSAIHLHFRDAFMFNRLFIIVFPILIYIWLKMLILSWKGRHSYLASFFKY